MEPEAVTEAAPASVPQITENAQPQVGMSAATAAAEEAYGGQTRSARLHMSREYGPVLDVRVVKDDGTNVHTFVDAQTGKVVVAAVMAAAARMAAVVFLIFIVKTSSNSCSCRCAGERLACRGALLESD